MARLSTSGLEEHGRGPMATTAAGVLDGHGKHQVRETWTGPENGVGGRMVPRAMVRALRAATT